MFGGRYSTQIVSLEIVDLAHKFDSLSHAVEAHSGIYLEVWTRINKPVILRPL